LDEDDDDDDDDDDVGSNGAWKSVTENIKISAKNNKCITN
jgi:hypothetical protein